MSKVKLFIDNFLVYGFGGIISKIIPLIMVPIVTRLMPSTGYFGISDLHNTIVQFASAIAIMGMYDAMYRMFFEKDDEEFKKQVCSTALMFTICTSAIVFILLIIFRKQVSDFFFGDEQYANIVYLSAIATLVGSTNSIISAPTRMQNKRKVFLVTNTLSPVISYSISIPLLLKGYYLIALPLAAIIAGLTMEISFGVLNRKWFKVDLINRDLLKQLLIIGVPLLPNVLVYWVFNSCDRVMITNLIGMEAAGIYSVGSKMGQCSQLIYSAFAGGWQFFAFSTMKEDNQVLNNSLIFEYLGIISFIISSFVCTMSYPLFTLLFPEQYASGFVVGPYLFIAPLIQMLFQVAGNQFLVIKKTWPSMMIIILGAFINIVLNIYLIPLIGIEGAAIATLFGYLASVLICVIVLTKMKQIVISKRFIFAAIAMIVYFVVWRICMPKAFLKGLLGAVLYSLLCYVLYSREVNSLLRGISRGFK